MTDSVPTLAADLTSALTATTPGSRASGSTGPSAARTDGPARVVIDLDLPGATISRHLYGHFAEHLGRCIYGGFYVGEDSEIPNTRGIRDDVVEALRALHIPNLRWPGGCFADDYHWRDGIGPREDRPRMVNSHWGDIVEDNSFGTHEFMDLVELLGTEAYVNGNVGSGTVAEMSDWIEYLTRADDSPMASLRRENGRDEPWTVPFFGIGNEAWGCGGNMRAEDYAALARQYATYVRDHGGNRVTRIAAGANVDDYAWTEALMRAATNLERRDGAAGPYQAISLHYYTMTGPWEDKGDATDFSDEEWYLTLSRAARAEELVARHATVMDHYDPHKKVGLVFDEWGTWWNVEPGTNPGFLYQQNTVRDALVAGIHFDGFHRHADRLLMANIAQTVNVLQAMILTDPESGALVLTPTYHVFAMNAAHQDARALAAHVLLPEEVTEVDGRPLPRVSASASLREEEDAALVSLSNLDASAPRTLVLDLRGREVTGHEATVLTGASTAAHNTPEQPDAVAPAPLTDVREHERGLEITLPPHSFATVRLQLGE
ncbi:alpha-N-arabinofuranosidase [Brachybacterium saurashtrense]|uniref:non-reducing end alpha-L-arabinofuranosidase n=1 Tax=Brachybacterium saurashtrense TaxID=556288 RepID=A0A345YQV6_9MICO|nr:alpha-L-arabinofuranosidase C-terminal domain-containing protein [Brachybacterium saurashtrense]AXK46308.1 alpha-N-arabinofuranosidase [Brachybacterium saurashtrense]RRR24048.1 alpha-N-arabinofuranosidase [Brachybacterium saurashtrense]